MPRILVLIGLAILAVVAAGCGSKPTSSGVAQLPSATTTTTSSSSNAPLTAKGKQDGARKFSVCMRAHGLAQFPDPQPDSGGGGGMHLSIGPGSGLDPNSPQFKAAQTACQKLLPNGGKPTPAEVAKAQADALKFSACMRSHGVPNFPDPQVSADGGMRIALPQNMKNSPALDAAQRACQSTMPGMKSRTSGPGPATP
jgi:hypothetical protein